MAGIVIFALFIYAVVQRWGEESALEGRYHWFGLLVLIEVLVAGIGCFILWRRQQSRWMAWWVAVIVASHFIPLAFLLNDWSLIGLGVIQVGALLVLVPRLKVSEAQTSRLVGPVMGVALLVFASVSMVLFAVQVGMPWS